MKSFHLFYGVVLILASIVICYAFVDRPLLERLRPDKLKSHIASEAPTLKTVIMNPDASRSSSYWINFLDWPPLLSTLSPWILLGALCLPRGKMRDFFLLLGLSILLTFALKNELKWIFGRPWPKVAAVDVHGGLNDSFHWFHGKIFQGSDETSAFPSGHAAIAFAALMPIGLYFRRLMPWCLLIGIMEGLGLTILGYHFLGDVLAGALLGISCTGAACAILQLKPSDRPDPGASPCC